MRFLAQLRHQNPEISDGFKLCYLLRIDQINQRVALSLGLAQLRNGRIDSFVRPYWIQIQHFISPPPFVTASDSEILQILAEQSEHWLQQSCGSLPETDGWTLLERILRTERCFVESKNDSWLPAHAGHRQAVSSFWRIGGTGEQAVCWQASVSENITCTGSPLLVCQINADDCVISEGISALCNAAIKAVNQFEGMLPAESVTAFLAEHKAQWLQWGLSLPEVLPTTNISATLTPVLHCFSRPATATTPAQDVLQLAFRYCSELVCVTFNAGASDGGFRYWDGDQSIQLQRQNEQEQYYLQQLIPLLSSLLMPVEPSLKADGDPTTLVDWHSNDKEKWQNFLIETRPQLEAMGFAFFIESNFRHHYVLIDQWRVDIDKDRSVDNYLQLSVQIVVEGQSINLIPLLKKLKAFNRSQQEKKQASIKLDDGRFLLLPFEKLRGIIDEVSDLLEGNSHNIRLPGSQLHRLHALHEQLPEDTIWQGDIEKLSQATAIHQAPIMLDSALCGVKAELRPYQWLGVCWLQHLKRHQVNGILADDMGLGKTLQTLAHLSLEKQQGQLTSPALIVVPTSLLHNWAAEIKRFTPHLSYQVLHGSNRHQYWTQLDDKDIVITSYHLIANDLNHWQQQKLSWMILDEAQVIKNARTRISKAVRQIESDQKLCLSGTPMQNNLGELWSLFDFLMPGCLGSLKYFTAYYRKPIEQQGNQNRLEHLLKRLAPFMLRREKALVATELPPKTEIHQYIPLNDDQQALYEQIKTSGWQSLQEKLSEQDNSGKQRLFILTALLKLRQVCCEPALLNEHTISSAKREHCIAMIRELVAEKRAILVFSQFTGMLDVLAKNLDEHDINYLMLTGQSSNRQALVDDFQQGKAPVFLVSLKAGGVGLNLTRADTVIHYDPWWNNAAEQQATDRAYRIGQDKPVFVYKLIAENTIEEKIALLQQRKASLSRHVNQQAQTSGEQFSINLEALLALWQTESVLPC